MMPPIKGAPSGRRTRALKPGVHAGSLLAVVEGQFLQAAAVCEGLQYHTGKSVGVPEIVFVTTVSVYVARINYDPLYVRRNLQSCPGMTCKLFEMLQFGELSVAQWLRVKVVVVANDDQFATM